jgi:hypothetical protein
MSAGERQMNATFIILRRETSGGYSTRGPVAQPVSLKEARDEIVRLKKIFPYQDFVIMGEVGEATKSERVTVKIDAPDLSEAKPRKRRPKERPAPTPTPLPMPAQAPAVAQENGESWNVVPLRKEETG